VFQEKEKKQFAENLNLQSPTDQLQPPLFSPFRAESQIFILKGARGVERQGRFVKRALQPRRKRESKSRKERPEKKWVGEKRQR
jgi:hypothetical protein